MISNNSTVKDNIIFQSLVLFLIGTQIHKSWNSQLGSTQWVTGHKAMVLHWDIQQAMQATLLTEMRHKCTRSKSNLTWRHVKFHLFILYTALHIFQGGIDPEAQITESQAMEATWCQAWKAWTRSFLQNSDCFTPVCYSILFIHLLIILYYPYFSGWYWPRNPCHERWWHIRYMVWQWCNVVTCAGWE